MEKDMVKVFKGLGHPIRLKIVKKLGKERLCVVDIVKEILDLRYLGEVK